MNSWLFFLLNKADKKEKNINKKIIIIDDDENNSSFKKLNHKWTKRKCILSKFLETSGILWFNI